LGEIAEHLEEVHGLRVAQSTVWRLLDRHEVSGARHRCPMDTGRPPPSSARSGSRA
jgi:hypothetical protein